MRAYLTMIMAMCTIVASALPASSEAGRAAPDLPGQLFQAIESGAIARATQLLDSGVGVAQTNERGMSPLVFLYSMSPYKGSQKARLDIASLLLEHGADPNEIIPPSVNPSRVPVFDWAIMATQSVDVVRLFLKKGADPKIEQSSPLLTSVMLNKKDIAALLITSGAEVNARDEFGQTPIFLVASIGMAKTLVNLGADVNAPNDEGLRVLKWLSDPYKGRGAHGDGCIPVNQKVIRFLKVKGARIGR